MKPVLIFTSKTDIHADFVAIEIGKLGGEIIRLNTEDLAGNTILDVAIRDGAPDWSLDIAVLDSGRRITEDAVDTVWYRKPDPVEPAKLIGEEHARDFVAEEFDHFLRSVYCLLSHKRWVNPYWNLRHASQKLPNLTLAARLGFRVPKTLITNDSSKAVAFVDACGGYAIVKTFQFSGFIVNQTEAWHCFANKVETAVLRGFADSVRLAPVFFQEYIAKSVELRVTVIGTAVFAAAIHSQEQLQAHHDWRALDPYRIKHTPWTLPGEIAEKLLAFNTHYELVFSTFDLIVSPDGDYVFLECNPNGQWYWVEELTGMPMANAMAKFLLGMSTTA